MHLFISITLSYKPTAELKMCVPGKLESVFVEIICTKESSKHIFLFGDFDVDLLK